MSYREVLGLPIRAFWLFNRNIDRLRAETDLRELCVAANSQSTDGVNATRERLVLELGVVDTGGAPDPRNMVRDREGLLALKALQEQL